MIMNLLLSVYWTLFFKDVVLLLVIFLFAKSIGLQQQRTQMKEHALYALQSVMIFLFISIASLIDLNEFPIPENKIVQSVLAITIILGVGLLVVPAFTKKNHLNYKIYEISSLLLILHVLFSLDVFSYENVRDLTRGIMEHPEVLIHFIESTQYVFKAVFEVVPYLFMIYIAIQLAGASCKIMFSGLYKEEADKQEALEYSTDFDTYFETKMRESQGPFWRDITKKLRWDIEQRKWVWKDPEE